MKPDDDWPFDQPRHCAVITLQSIANGSEPILHVTHDKDDHGWQFLSLRDADTEEGCVLGLSCVVEMDPSLIQLADMPPGWHAWRESVEHSWNREPSPIEWDNEDD